MLFITSYGAFRLSPYKYVLQRIEPKLRINYYRCYRSVEPYLTQRENTFTFIVFCIEIMRGFFSICVRNRFIISELFPANICNDCCYRKLNKKRKVTHSKKRFSTNLSKWYSTDLGVFFSYMELVFSIGVDIYEYLW